MPKKVPPRSGLFKAIANSACHLHQHLARFSDKNQKRIIDLNHVQSESNLDELLEAQVVDSDSPDNATTDNEPFSSLSKNAQSEDINNLIAFMKAKDQAFIIRLLGIACIICAAAGFYQLLATGQCSLLNSLLIAQGVVATLVGIVDRYHSNQEKKKID